jgi:hypothetical protein
MRSFLTSFVKVLISFDFLLFKVVTELNDTILCEMPEAWNQHHEINDFVLMLPLYLS